MPFRERWSWMSVAFGFAAGPIVSGCSDLTIGYNSAVSAVAVELQRYAVCIEGLRATDDCRSQFMRLREAQSNLEGAVSQRQAGCP